MRCRWSRRPSSRRRRISSMCCSSCRWAASIRSTGTACRRNPRKLRSTKSMFALYSNTAGTPAAGCFLPAGRERRLLPGTQTPANLFNGSGCANQRQASLNNSDSENLIVVKIDHTINANNSVWYRFQQDTGLQAAYTDPDQPDLQLLFSRSRSARLCSATRTCFTPNLVNQFNPGASWYSSLFQPNNYRAGAADLSHRAGRWQRQCAVHHHWRQRQDLYAGPQSHAVADQRQPDLDASSPHLQVRR